MRFFWSSIFYVFSHSFIAHKEHRFLLPIIPLLIPYLYIEAGNYPKCCQKIFTAITILLNIVLAIYFGNLIFLLVILNVFYICEKTKRFVNFFKL